MADPFKLLEAADAKAVAVHQEEKPRTPKARRRVAERRAEAAKLALMSDPKGELPAKKRPSRIDVKKSQDRIRREIAAVVELYSGKVGEWLAAVGKYDPEKALRIYTGLLEYQLPKQVRTELDANVKVAVAHFVAVEQREEKPALLDVTPIEVPSVG